MAWTSFAGSAEPWHHMAVEHEGRLVGGAGLEAFEDVHAGTAEVGYWLGVDFWGRGLATAVLGGVTRYAFEELGFERLQAGVYDWNPASARVLEKAGYRLEGRLRRHVQKGDRWADVLMYARLRSDE